ncbi:MAG TPA: hypothetical protein DCR04_04100 [Flavobacteriales bacterium]|nr:hypothetical protein [Flavobacteriales bacterium]
MFVILDFGAAKVIIRLVLEFRLNIKRRISICTGLKEFESAQRTLAGIEVVNIIRKGQMTTSKSTHFETFKSLAA